MRLAKQKQQLELEQQELELQKLRKEQALRFDELEESHRKIAQATLVEMELRKNISEYNVDFHERLSRLSASSEGKEIARINDWVNNSPSGAETDMQPSIGAQASIVTTDTLEVQPTPPKIPRRRCLLCSGSRRSTKNTGSEFHDDDSKSDNPKPSFATAATTSCTL